MARSASVSTIVWILGVIELLLVSPSTVEVVTDVVFVVLIEPVESEGTLTIISKVAGVLVDIVPRVHVGTPPPKESSAQPDVLAKVTPEGIASVTTTFWASSGPALVTSIV